MIVDFKFWKVVKWESISQVFIVPDAPVKINGKVLWHRRHHKHGRPLGSLHFSEMKCLTPKGSESCITGNDHWDIVCLITWIWCLVDCVINRLWVPRRFLGISVLRFSDYINGNHIVYSVWKCKLECSLIDMSIWASSFFAQFHWL